MSQLISTTSKGLWCEQGDFYIDPWQPVERAVVTHAHADHARRGAKRYLTTVDGLGVLQRRMGAEASIRTLAYGETLTLNGVAISLHPAGHLLGSAQVRVEFQGEVWVVSGDYKVEPDTTCAPFEALPCHTFITESTFGLPIYQWPPQQQIFADIHRWWRGNQAEKRTTILYAYALGKAQRVLAGLDSSLGPILVHGSVYQLNQEYVNAGVQLPSHEYAGVEMARKYRGQAIVVAPPSAKNNPGYLRKFGAASHGFASGWMTIRGARRRRAVDRGFILSDHADWKGLLSTIKATGAERVGVTHGYRNVLVRYLRNEGLDAWAIETEFEGEGVAEDGEQDATDLPLET